MAHYTKPIRIMFDEPFGVDISKWLKSAGLKAEKLPDLECEVSVEFDASELDDDEIEQEFRDRFGDDDAVTRAYRLLGEGDVKGAMEELAHAFNHLRNPDAECRLAGLIARGRAKDAQGVLL